MTMQRRLAKLEAAQPEAAFAARVLFRDSDGADPTIDPPLRQNEMAIVVNFVSARAQRAERQHAAREFPRVGQHG